MDFLPSPIETWLWEEKARGRYIIRTKKANDGKITFASEAAASEEKVILGIKSEKWMSKKEKKKEGMNLMRYFYQGQKTFPCLSFPPSFFIHVSSHQKFVSWSSRQQSRVGTQTYDCQDGMKLTLYIVCMCVFAYIAKHERLLVLTMSTTFTCLLALLFFSLTNDSLATCTLSLQHIHLTRMAFESQQRSPFPDEGPRKRGKSLAAFKNTLAAKKD